MPARQYRSTVEAKTLSAGINNSITSMTLNSITTLPTSYPYTLVIDPDLATEEIVTVTANAGGNQLTIVRGENGTSAQAHNAAAVVKHMITARDLQEPQDHIFASSAIHGVTGSVVGTSDTQTLTNKSINLNANTLTGTTALFNTALSDGNFATQAGTETLTNKTLTSPTIDTPTITSPTISGTITGAVVTSANIVDGTIVDADINASAAIAQSKVASLTTDLGLKAPLANPTFTGTVAGVTKSMVGLGNVDNTTDAGKPVSSATQTALDAKLSLSGGTLSGNLASSGFGQFTTNAGAGRGVCITQPSGDATPAILQFTNNAASAQRGNITVGADGTMTFNPAGSNTTINGDLDVSNDITGDNFWISGQIFLTGGDLQGSSGADIYTDTGSIYNYTSAIDGTGCRPINDNVSSLGTLSAQRRWTRLYAVNTTISSSDERDKIDVEESPLGLDFINDLRPVAYRWKVGEKTQVLDEDGNPVFDENGESVLTTREGVRKHYGLISQEVKQAIDNSGVDDFAGWVKDDMSDPESHQSLSYEQFIAPLIKSVQELSAEVQTLKAKVAELEAK